MKVLFIKHIDIEGPGTMGSYLEMKKFKYDTVELFNDVALPDNLSGYDAIVILGGPMNVYEEEKYPFLKDEDLLIKKALNQKTPMLGLCLGGQLIAKACGAIVKKTETKEIGWFKVTLTSMGQEDPLFTGLPTEIEVFQWHGDTFDVPENGKHLAFSSLCRNQAFKYNDNVYALQFHLEVTQTMVSNWLTAYSDEVKSTEGVNSDTIIEYARQFSIAYNKQANIFYSNFFNVCKNS